MDITILEAREMYSALIAFKDKDFPALTTFKILKVVESTEPIFKRSETVKNDLIKKFGTPKEDNSEIYTLPNDKIEDFSKEWDAIMEQIESIPDVTFNIGDFGDVKLPLNFMYALKKIIKE